MIIGRTAKSLSSIAIFLIMSFFLPLFCLAEERFVQPSAEVVIRTGEGREYKVIGMVKDGDAVELLEEGESYALVRLPDGKEGWMLKRYLSKSPPLSNVVVSLRAENEKIKQKEVEITQKFEEVSARLEKTLAELDISRSEREQVNSDYQNLLQDTADVRKITEDTLRVTQENELLVQEIASIKEENNELKKDKSINWFLAGGGVLLIGMFIGRLNSNSRKRRSSLM